MFNILGTDISLTRGDTLMLDISLKNPNGTDYTPQEGDVLRFAMKTNYLAPECVILKPIDVHTLTLEIQPSDTKELSYGRYDYDIELTDDGGHVSTPIIGTFTLTKEVY